jgi:hypothetical protein
MTSDQRAGSVYVKFNFGRNLLIWFCQESEQLKRKSVVIVSAFPQECGKAFLLQIRMKFQLAGVHGNGQLETTWVWQAALWVYRLLLTSVAVRFLRDSWLSTSLFSFFVFSIGISLPKCRKIICFKRICAALFLVSEIIQITKLRNYQILNA